MTGNQWFKSTHSGPDGCVEIARHGDEFLVRDSKDPDGHVLRFNRTEWTAFVQGVEDGQFRFES